MEALGRERVHEGCSAHAPSRAVSVSWGEPGRHHSSTQQFFSLALSSLASEKRNALLSLPLGLCCPQDGGAAGARVSVLQPWGSPLAGLGSPVAAEPRCRYLPRGRGPLLLPALLSSSHESSSIIFPQPDLSSTASCGVRMVQAAASTEDPAGLTRRGFEAAEVGTIESL